MYRRLGLYRRLNLILYLNQDWQHGDGGELELTRPSQISEARIVKPLLNRAILFQTDDNSVHGFTTPVREGTSRRSIAVYYYTASETKSFSGDQTTHWREHGTLGFMKNVRLLIYKTLLKASRFFFNNRTDYQSQSGFRPSSYTSKSAQINLSFFQYRFLF